MKRPRDGRAAASRLEAIASRWALDDVARGRLSRLLELVQEDPRAGTSVRDPAAAADVHVADSLSALPALDAAVADRPIADIGSGDGFPGLPLAIARPQLRFDLVESVGRRCAFLEHAVAELELTGVGVVNERAEDWAAAEGYERYGAVVVRAVDALPILVEYAAPLLSAGGKLVAWKGAREAAEEEAGRQAAEIVGLASLPVEHVVPYPGSRDHNLHLYEKVRPTPERFPRRAGMARKRPLA